MNDDALEGLMTDQAIGELPPATSWLLEQYLAEHREHRPAADEIRRTVALARRALASEMPAPSPMPPMPIPRRRWTYLWPATCAACLVLGWLVRTATTPSVLPNDSSNVPIVKREPPPAVGPVKPAPVAPAVASVAGHDSLWSLAAWAERAERRSPSADHAAIEWKAPFEPKIPRGVQ